MQMRFFLVPYFVLRDFKFGKSGEHDMASAESSETGKKKTDCLILLILTNLAVSVHLSYYKILLLFAVVIYVLKLERIVLHLHKSFIRNWLSHCISILVYKVFVFSIEMKFRYEKVCCS